jgi:hypothetical protein
MNSQGFSAIFSPLGFGIGSSSQPMIKDHRMKLKGPGLFEATEEVQQAEGILTSRESHNSLISHFDKILLLQI